MSKDKTKSRALAVSLALIMLVSVAGTAFVGGAAAQSQTGGTYDGLYNDQSDIGNNNNLNIGSGEAQLIDGITDDRVKVRSDGRVYLPGDSAGNTFDGLSFSLDYIDRKTSADLSSNISNENYADLLDQVPNNYNVSVNASEPANNATPAIFIEFNPESDFSQVNISDGNLNSPSAGDVRGNHDYIVVAPANQTSSAIKQNSQLLGLTDKADAINDSAAGSDGKIVALSVENGDGPGANSSLIANGSNFANTLGKLTGDSDTDLQNKYIDGVTFAAGTFNGPAVTIEEVKLGDNIDLTTSETIHSEKIELYNGTDTTYHSSIDGALTELTVDGSGDEVRLAGGTYGAIEPTTELNVTSNVTITRQGSAAEAYTRVNTTSNKAFNSTGPNGEPIINTALNLTGAATVSDIGLNDSTPVVDISADDTTLDNVIVNSTGINNPAIEVNNTAGISSVTNGTNGTVITGSAVVSDTPLSVSSGTGLDLNVTDGTGEFDGANLSTNFADISNNYFIGFQTQVTGVNKSEATTIYNNNNFGVEVTDQSFTGNGGAQYADAHLSQAAVPFNGSTVNATITGVGKDNSNISGSVEAGDNAAGPGDEIQVTGGTYAGPDPVDIMTSNVVVSGSGPAAVNISGTNGVVLNNADSIELSGVNVTQGNVTARSSESNVTISDVELPAASANVSIKNAYSVNVTGVTLSDARVDVVNITDALEGDLTVADTTANNVTGGSALGNSSQTAINVSNNVSVTNFDVTGNSTALKTGAIDGVNLTDVGPTGDVTVQQSQFTNLGNGTALAFNQSRGDGSYGYTLTVQDNTFTSNTQSFTGVVHNLPNVTSDTTAADIENAINYGELQDGVDPFFDLNDNSPRTGSLDTLLLKKSKSLRDVPGVSEATLNGSIDNNTIIGANSSTGTGITIVNGTSSQFDSLAETETLSPNGNYVTINVTTNEIANYGANSTSERVATDIKNNEISGFARNVESQDNVSASAFDNIGSSNTFGTLVYGTNGYASDFGTTYPGAGDVDGYIPGSVNAALTLINTSEAGTSTLEIKDPSNVASGPQVYKETSTLTIPDSDGVTLTGESKSVEVRSNISIPNANALNNHAVSDLTLNHTGSGPALDVTSNNSQTTFDNLVVESDGEGLNVTAESGDVNVIELTNSELKVQSNGIVLGAGADDRDGYVIHNTEIRSTDNSVGSGTGLNLSALDQPGEAGEDRTDLTGLNITNNYIAGFETQVEMPASSEANITALNFTSSQFGGSFDIDTQLSNNNLNTSSIDIGNNAFGQQVMVFNTTNIPGSGTSDPDGTDYANISLNDTNLYGSIDTAVAAAGADSTNVTVRVYDGGDIYGSPASSPTTYEENVEIGNNVTVRGPAYDAGSGGAALRTPGARINGTLKFNSNAGNGTSNGTANIATVTGFTVTAEDGNAPVVELTGGTGNVTIANSTVSAIGNRTLDLPEEMARGVKITDTSTNAVSTVNLTGLYVGDHDAVQTVNTSVYVDDTVNLTISDSELVGQSPATARRTTNGTGLNITDTPAAENATVTVTSSTIKNFAQAGVDANATRDVTKYGNGNPIVLSGTTIENNDGAGVVAAGNISRTVTVNASSTVTNNNIGVHVKNENATINVLGSTVNAQNGTTAGIQLDDSANSSSINGTAVVNNNIGLLVDAEFNGLDVTNNNFTNPTDIQNDGSTTLNATLNYFGNSNVSVVDAAGSTTIYDPMLSQDLTGDYPTDVSQTTHFAHDIEVPAQTAITVGFPAEPEGTYVDDVFRFDEMVNNPADYALYGLDRTESGPELTALTADANNRNTQVGAHDAFIVWNNKSTSFSAGQITYTDPSPATLPSPYTFDEKGVHFVAPSGYGNASAVLVDGSGGDMIATGINTQNGSNLYGVASQTNTTFSGANDPGDLNSTFVDTFKETADSRDVHPHRGYFVIVSEDSTVSTRMPGSSTIVTGEAPTAANIDQKLNQSAP